MSGSDLFTGTLELIILRTLRGGKLHGYAIGKHIRETSHGVLEVDEGALYPALHRLQRKGLLISDWGKTDTGRRAKFYSLSAVGTKHLQKEAARWSEYSMAVHAVLSNPEG